MVRQASRRASPAASRSLVVGFGPRRLLPPHDGGQRGAADVGQPRRLSLGRGSGTGARLASRSSSRRSSRSSMRTRSARTSCCSPTPGSSFTPTRSCRPTPPSRSGTTTSSRGELNERARRMYLRARDYGLRNVEVAITPASAERLRCGSGGARSRSSRRPTSRACTIWAARGFSPSRSAWINRRWWPIIPVARALLDRALELDEDYERGTLHVGVHHARVRRRGDGRVLRAGAGTLRPGRGAVGRERTRVPTSSLASPEWPIAEENREEFQRVAGNGNRHRRG